MEMQTFGIFLLSSRVQVIWVIVIRGIGVVLGRFDIAIFGHHGGERSIVPVPVSEGQGSSYDSRIGEGRRSGGVSCRAHRDGKDEVVIGWLVEDVKVWREAK